MVEDGGPERLARRRPLRGGGAPEETLFGTRSMAVGASVLALLLAMGSTPNDDVNRVMHEAACDFQLALLTAAQRARDLPPLLP